MQLIKPSISTITKIRGDKTQDIYVHPNILVRWLFWERPRAVLKYIGINRLSKKANILDFGCGEGVFLPTLANYFHKVEAHDLRTNEAERLCKTLAIKNVKFCRDFEKIENRYDVIIALDVLEHIKNIDEITYKLLTLLNKNGLLIITGPSENILYEAGRKIFGFTKPPDHYYSIKEIESVLSSKADLIKKRYIPVSLLFSLNPFTMLVYRKRENV